MSTKRNTLYNLGGAIAPALVMLVTVPLYLQLVGDARYGVLAIIWLLTGYFGFFDFGLGRSTAYAISRISDDDHERRAETFWTALIINIGFGIMGALLIIAVVPLLFDHVFAMSDDLYAELRPVIWWLGLSVPLLTIEGVFTGALTGSEKFRELNLRAIIASVLTQGLPLVFVWWIAPTLTVAVPATIAARAVSVSIFAMIAFKSVSAGVRPRFGGREMARSLLGYGGWVSIGQAISPLIANLDRLLIAAFLNPVAVAYYSVPYQLVTRGGFFSRALGNALFPRMSRLDEDAVNALTWKAVRANAALMAILCTTGLIIMEPFLHLWVGSAFATQAASVGEQLTITVWLTSMAVILHNHLEARGKPKETFIILATQAVPYAVLAFAGLHYFGIIGVAIARNFRSLLNLLLLAARSGFLVQILQLIIVPLILLIALAWYSDIFQVSIPLRAVISLSFGALLVIFAVRTFPEGIDIARASFVSGWAKLRGQASTPPE